VLPLSGLDGPLGGAASGDVLARSAAAEDDDVELVHGHF
jgi:hypothetical protein